ncbi:hypothetical protein B296_00037520 [Ensete ventricosum]|uniref:Uncharacterized protein n=1 Tax=Ensete ventricosum TaxID=4639 RepID=A0A426XPJ9_ENSVE|nr:hypothetical protein B296_00037520 [Ensete ventricosum]
MAVAALRHCQRLLAVLVESKGVTLGLVEGSMDKISKLLAMVAVSLCGQESWSLEVTLRLGTPSRKDSLAARVCWPPMVGCSQWVGYKRTPWRPRSPSHPRFPYGQRLLVVRVLHAATVS